MFDAASAGEANGMGGSVLAFWGRAVRWFRDELVNSDSDLMLRQFLDQMFRGFLTEQNGEGPGVGGTDATQRVHVLKGLMQTWVRWFADPTEARAFLGDGVVEGMMAGSLSAKDLVQHYEELCDLLNPATHMKAPRLDDPRERGLWQFPVFAERLPKPPSTAPQQSAAGKGVRGSAQTKTGKIMDGGDRPQK